jgi:hypothetical protein
MFGLKFALRSLRQGRLAYAAVGDVWFDVWFAFLVFGRTRFAVGLSAPICFASLRKFRFNPLRGFVVSQQFYFYNFAIILTRQ